VRRVRNSELERLFLCGGQGGCLLSVTLMLLARHSHVVLYLGTAMFGMFLSSVAPTSISLAESYIDVTCTSCLTGHVS